MQMSLVVRKPWIKSRWNMRAQKCFPWVFSIAFPILKSCVSRLEFCHHKRSFNGFTEKYLVLLRYWCLETLLFCSENGEFLDDIEAFESICFANQWDLSKTNQSSLFCWQTSYFLFSICCPKHTSYLITDDE